MLHHIELTQLIKHDIDEVWNFMSSPKNLAAITPEYMHFEILSDLGDGKMHQGQIIEYYVRPILNLKLHWVTEITHVKEKAFFVDEQRFGPYTFWHHKHSFKQTNEGVLMTDTIHYKLPLGLIGKLANSIFVRQQLNQVFQYRHDVLDKRFNSR